MSQNGLVKVAKTAFSMWQKENASLRAAALAFFIALPLPSLLLFADQAFILVYGPEIGAQHLSNLIGTLLGPTIQSLVSQLLQETSSPFTSVFGSVLSIVFAFAGAIGAFLVLQDSLNTIWGVEFPKKPTLKRAIRERLTPFLHVFGAATIVTIWVAATMFLFNTAGNSISPIVGELVVYIGLFIVQLVLSFAMSALLFAVIFKEVPDTKIEWRDVALAAIITGIAFTVLNNVFGLYLRSFPVTTLAGAAGSLILLLLWLFVIAEILFYGAYFANCYTEMRGSHSKQAHDKEPPGNRFNFSEIEDTVKTTSTRIQSAITSKTEKKPQPPPVSEQIPIPETKPQHSETKPASLQKELNPVTQTPTPARSVESVTQKEQATPSLYNEIRRQQEEKEKAATRQDEQIIFELKKKKPEPQNGEAEP